MPKRERPGESSPRRKRNDGQSANQGSDYLLEAVVENWPHILAAYRQFEDKKPVVLYDIPYRTGVRLELDTLLTLAAHPRIQAIKDCAGSLDTTLALIRDGRLQVLAGNDLDTLVAAARSLDFKPQPLGVTTSINFTNKLQRARTANVFASLPGSDPKAKSEYVIYTAHHDHLGIGTPNDS